MKENAAKPCGQSPARGSVFGREECGGSDKLAKVWASAITAAGDEAGGGSGMNQEQTIALFQQGKEAWNALAGAMLTERKVMEAEGAGLLFSYNARPVELRG